jgi:hypothetical protein
MQLASGATARNRNNAGVFWLSISLEARKAVIIPRGTPEFLVLDLDTASVSKRCGLPKLPMPVVYFHLVDLPARGLTLAAEMFRDGTEKLAGMLLDPSISCADSLVDVAPTDLLEIRILGRTGVGDAGSNDTASVRVESSGGVIQPVLGAKFPFAIPESILAAFHGTPLASLLAANSNLLAIGLFEAAGPHQIAVYRRRDASWHTLPIPATRVHLNGGQSTPLPLLTAFGNFVALTEVRGKEEVAESAGRAAWKQLATDTGPSMKERFDEDELAYPGRLHLFDIAHDRSYELRTGQGDSEVLLVEDRTLYYRVGDAIFKAAIGDASLGEAQLVGRSPLLNDVHWAFIAHP